MVKKIILVLIIIPKVLIIAQIKEQKKPVMHVDQNDWVINAEIQKLILVTLQKE